MSPRILFLDTETGGLDPHLHDLLSIGLVVWEKGKLLAEKEIKVQGRPERCTEQALRVNKIQLEEHNRQALPPKAAVREVIAFLEENFDYKPVIVGGHNVGFDLAFLRVLFAKGGLNLEDYLSHRVIDTSSILQYLGLLQGYDREQLQRAASSDEAFRHYRIPLSKRLRHTALGDARATAQLFSHLIDRGVPALS